MLTFETDLQQRLPKNGGVQLSQAQNQEANPSNQYYFRLQDCLPSNLVREGLDILCTIFCVQPSRKNSAEALFPGQVAMESNIAHMLSLMPPTIFILHRDAAVWHLGHVYNQCQV